MNQFLIRLVCCFVPKRELRHFLRRCRFGRYKVKGKNNKIIFAGHKLPKFLKIAGLKININGNNNSVIIGNHVKTSKSSVDIGNDNADIKICDGVQLYNIFIRCAFGDSQSVIIGENSVMYGGAITCDECQGAIIGKNCLFGSNLRMRSSDGHSILSKDTNNILNMPKKDIEIGDHVWLGANVAILKNASIPNNTIVGIDSIVTKQFDTENTIIAGNPAQVIKTGVDWSPINPYVLNKIQKGKSND